MYIYNEKDDFQKPVDRGNNFLQLYVFIITSAASQTCYFWKYESKGFSENSVARE